MDEAPPEESSNPTTTTTPGSPDPWYFVYRSSRDFWERGEQVLLFRQAGRNRAGETALAFRAEPWTLALPGPLAGVKDTAKGWWRHPATEIAKRHYGLVEALGLKPPPGVIP